MFCSKEEYLERKELEKIVRKIDRDCDALVVEGPSDRIVMQKLGFKGRIYLSAEKKTEDLVEDISRISKKAAILTDFDKHGKKQSKEITHQLNKEIDVIKSYRKEFGKKITENDRRAVEDIMPLLSYKEEKFTDAALSRLFKSQRDSIDSSEVPEHLDPPS